MKQLLLGLLLVSSPVFADSNPDNNIDDYFEEQSEETFEPKRSTYDDSDSSYLRDEAHWPSQNQDPFLESLSR